MAASTSLYSLLPTCFLLGVFRIQTKILETKKSFFLLKKPYMFEPLLKDIQAPGEGPSPTETSSKHEILFFLFFLSKTLDFFISIFCQFLPKFTLKAWSYPFSLDFLSCVRLKWKSTHFFNWSLFQRGGSGDGRRRWPFHSQREIVGPTRQVRLLPHIPYSTTILFIYRYFITLFSR